MLRLFHTADWHLGQSFHGFDRDSEHAAFLTWLLEIMQTRRPDVLLVAGDVFDSINPAATAQRRFFDFLARAHAALPSLQIVLTAGNHDAAARLEAPAGLMESLNISVVGTVKRDAAGEVDCTKFLVPLRDAAGNVQALALAVPFLRPSDVPVLTDAADPYLDGIRDLYRRTTEAAAALRDAAHPGAVLLALGHCHMQDGAESRDSERRLVIGGAEALRAETFPAELAYVALGHLHKPQELDGGRIGYSGSPIPLSFSEKDYNHRIIEVVLDPSGSVSLTSLTSLPVPKTAALLRLPAGAAVSLEAVLQCLGETTFDDTRTPETWPFLEVRVLDNGPDPTRRRRIEEALDGKPVRLASIKLESPGRPAALSTAACAPALEDLSAIDPEEILTAAHQERYGIGPDAALLTALREILTAPAAAAS